MAARVPEMRGREVNVAEFARNIESDPERLR
jgi:hypothetical protein